eukprot:s273_g13.t1
MGTLITAAELEAITSVAHARAWSGLPEPVWQALSQTLGGVDHLRVLAYIPPVALRQGLRTARVPTPAVGDPADANYIPAGDRAFTAVEGAQVGLLYQVALAKLGRPLVDPLIEPSPATVAPGGGTVNPPTGTPAATNPARKVKNSQADEGEIPELTQVTVEEHYKVLRKAKGGPVRPEAEPSPDQISAMKGRFSRTLKFLNHVLQPDGTFKAVEVPGPPSYDENTLLMLEKDVGGNKVPVATVAAMEAYKDAFRDLVVCYPEAWHLLVVAEDRCRKEHFVRLKRELEEKYARGLTHDYDPDQPWNEVFRVASRNREFWDRHVREPALLFRTSGRHKEQVGGTGSATDHTGTKGAPKRNKKSQKERLKAQLAKAREGKGNAASEVPAQGGRTKATFEELFAGEAGLTRAVGRIGGERVQIRRPQDTKYGHDITDDREFLEMMDAETPDWRHMAPPCRTFTKARRKDRHGTVAVLRSDSRPEGFGDEQTVEANGIADRCVSLGEKQLEEGKWFSLENPEPSYIWELKSVKRLRSRPGVRLVILDQCAYGGPFKKTTIVLTNCPWLFEGRRCGDAPRHAHTVLEGRVWSYKDSREVWLTAEAAEYPTGLCEAWAEAWVTWLGDQSLAQINPPKACYRKIGRHQNKLVREELKAEGME